MMGDTPDDALPARLRAHLTSFRYFGDHALADLIEEAATEIEQLQAGLDRLLVAELIGADEARLRDGLQALLAEVPETPHETRDIGPAYRAVVVDDLRDALHTLLARPPATEESR